MRLLHAASRTSASFDEANLVSRAGLVPAVRLAQNVGLEALVDRHVRVWARVGANAGLKVGTLVAGMVAGADCIDDVEASGTWVSDGEVAEVGYTAFASSTAHRTQGRLIVRRVKRLNPKAAPVQGKLLPDYRYHAVFTDSPFTMLQAESQHRGHAVIEFAFADLVDGPPAHLPSGSFPANWDASNSSDTDPHRVGSGMEVGYAGEASESARACSCSTQPSPPDASAGTSCSPRSPRCMTRPCRTPRLAGRRSRRRTLDWSP